MHPPAVPPRRRRAAPSGVAVAVAALAAGAVLAVAVLLLSGGGPRAPEVTAPTGVAAATAVETAIAADAADAGAVRSSAIASADVEVRVVDEVGRPVAGATVRLSATLGSLRGTADPVSTAVTDAGGRAVLHGVPPGRWLASAAHAELLDALGLQDAGERRLVTVPGRTSTTLRLGEPYVVGVRVRGGEVLHQQFDQDSSAFLAPLGESLLTVGQLQRPLAERWPGATFQFWLRAHREQRRPGDHCSALVVVRGRAVWTSDLSPVPLREFQGPIELDAAQLTRSDDFGTVTLRALDIGGDVTDGLAVNIWTDFRTRRLDHRIENGGEVTLPGGDYSLYCSELFLRQLLPKGGTLGRGQRWSIDFGGRLLTRCEIALDGPPETRNVRIAHSTLVEPVDCPVQGRGTRAFWLPEGTITATFHGLARDRAAGARDAGLRVTDLGRSAAVVVGCGTMAAPQHVVLAPLARR